MYNIASSILNNQQRSHIKHEAFYQLFSDFATAYPGTKYLDNYQILACDGSHVVYATDPNNTDDYVKPRKEEDKGYNQLQLKKMRYVMRVKDFNSCKCILSSFKNEFPDTPEFDVEIKRFITRSGNKIQHSQPDVYLEHKADKTFDYASAHASGKDRLFFISFRVVRIKLGENNYECLITNLPAYEFSPAKLKEIYHKFLKFQANTLPPDVIGWMERNLSVCKQEFRNFPRNLRCIGAVSFFYRVA